MSVRYPLSLVNLDNVFASKQQKGGNMANTISRINVHKPITANWGKAVHAKLACRQHFYKGANLAKNYPFVRFSFVGMYVAYNVENWQRFEEN